MNTEIKALEVKIQKLFEDERQPNPRTVFDIGVEFGCTLRKYNIENYEYEFWSNREHMKINQSKIRNEIQKINHLMVLLFKKYVSKLISKYGQWHISSKDLPSYAEKINEEMARNYDMKIERVYMSDDERDFEIIVMLTGKTKEIYDEYGITPKLLIIIEDEDGEHSVQINNQDELDNLQVTIGNKFNECMWDLERFQKFKQEVEKAILFNIIK